MRYEKCWIPFLAHHSAGPHTDLDFLPPLDVHWVWHLHMLAPLRYREDLLASSLGRIINHQPRDPQTSQARDVRERTSEKWTQLFQYIQKKVIRKDLKSIIFRDLSILTKQIL